MKRFIGYARTSFCLALAAILLAAALPAGAVTFDDSYCERSFKGEKLWTGNYGKRVSLADQVAALHDKARPGS